MKDILLDLDEWQRRGEEIALATVIRVQRSAPRPAGARLAVTRSGRMAGSVSGGCVEADVFERALQVMDSGKPSLVNYGIADELGFQVGLSCGGSIDVLIESFVSDPPWASLRQAVESEQPAVYAIGLAPTNLLGHKMTMLPGGETIGSIHPALDSLLVEEGQDLLRTGGTKTIAPPWEGEEAQVYLEAFPPVPSLVIVGATHTAVSLCRMAKEVGLQVTVIDARSALATEERFPGVDQIIRSWPDEGLGQLCLGDHSSVVVLTHDPKFDIPALAYALCSQARYIGALGSRVTHQQRRAQLLEKGFSEADLSRVRAPIGLDIGARTPEELALAILAEVLAVRYGRA